jgi:hypothetical protein
MRSSTHEPRVVSCRLATCSPSTAAQAVRATLERAVSAGSLFYASGGGAAAAGPT